jgi:monoamine oxidase
MIEADTGNVAFAGEAFSKQWEATAHGAWASGRDVAGRLADNFKLAG